MILQSVKTEIAILENEIKNIKNEIVDLTFEYANNPTDETIQKIGKLQDDIENLEIEVRKRK